jgi:3-oxoadipate enol-lactonase/4-carboxymuconolactone decarboxylase
MRLAITDFGGAGRPTLLLGPSLGTSVTTLWAGVAAELTDRYHVLGWDLPGHGESQPAQAFSVLDLAQCLIDEIDAPCEYAGVSLGGAVGLQLLLSAPMQVTRATLFATGARIGEPDAWRSRAAQVRAEGIGFLIGPSRERWFAPKFCATQVADALIADLATVDPESYASACQALADYDVRSRLAEIATPLLAVAGAHDLVTSPPALRHIAQGVQHGRLVIVADTAHQIPAEAPEATVNLLTQPLENDTLSVAEVRAAGMLVRREVLGDAYVDRASAEADGFTADFQDFITRYAWGSIWTRPGLDPRSRSMITLTALVARGHYEELAMHLRAALTNGMTIDEIKELLLQTAIYCGVPDANAAFRVARQVFETR